MSTFAPEDVLEGKYGFYLATFESAVMFIKNLKDEGGIKEVRGGLASSTASNGPNDGVSAITDGASSINV